MKPPCKQGEKPCENRSPGCAITCPAWAEYLIHRAEEYKRRQYDRESAEAIADGRRRVKYDIKK